MALLDLATEEAQVEAVGQELDCLAAACDTVPEFALFCASPVILLQRKLEILGPSLQDALLPLTRQFLAVLLRRGRGPLLPAVARQYRLIQEARRRQVRVLVESAVPLDDEQRHQVEQLLARELMCTPVMEVRVDPSLLGGLRLQVGGRVVDATLVRKLNRLREKLLSLRSYNASDGPR